VLPPPQVTQFPAFYVTQSSLPCSQQPATYSYSQPINPLHSLIFSYLKSIFCYPPYRSWSSKWPLSLRFPHQTPCALHFPPLRATCPAPCSSRTTFQWAVQISMLLVTQLSPGTSHFLPTTHKQYISHKIQCVRISQNIRLLLFNVVWEIARNRE
jgi:hypothetical protein